MQQITKIVVVQHMV